MRIVSIDDEKIANDYFIMIMKSIKNNHDYHNFTDPFTAIEYIRTNKTDLVFCDIEMPNLTGIDVAKQLILIDEDIKIVFTTGHEQYAIDAFKLNAVGYLLKPFSRDDIIKQIEKAKRITPLKKKKRVFARTFGNFDLFVDDKLVMFNRSKAKEFLAVLIDKKGGFVSTNEMIGYLFEDEPITENLKSNYRNILCNLQILLVSYGIDDIFIKVKGGCSIDMTKIDCDYYDFLDGDHDAITSFHGEYMSNYSWAEDTLAYLLNIC